MIRVGNTLILNGDNRELWENTDLTNLCPLTCGLSLRSTVTASSIQEDGFTYCLQRSIFRLDGTEIPPQEFNIHWQTKPEDIYPHLALATILLLCGVDHTSFSELQF